MNLGNGKSEMGNRKSCKVAAPGFADFPFPISDFLS